MFHWFNMIQIYTKRILYNISIRENIFVTFMNIFFIVKTQNTTKSYTSELVCFGI